MLLPEPVGPQREPRPRARRAYDAYQSMLMEPWDGPAAIAYTDGRTFGAALDRNGLRPARYYVTRDDRFLLSSEVGTIEIDPANVLTAGCLGPGRDARGRFCAGPREVLERRDCAVPLCQAKALSATGFAEEDSSRYRGPRCTLRPMPPCEDADVPDGRAHGPAWATTGTTSTRRCVPWRRQARCPWPRWASTRRLQCSPRSNRSFFDYFYQLFAQVTNPPIDALRESLVTSTELYLGNHGNLA